MYLVERRLFPVALPVAAFGAAPTTTPPAKALPTIAELRTKLKARMDKLRSYDLFLRDRNVIEWFKDNSAIVHWVVRSKDSRARHEESHEFWAHLDDAQKRQLVARWIDLVEAGAKLQGDAGRAVSASAMVRTRPCLRHAPLRSATGYIVPTTLSASSRTSGRRCASSPA